jgi:hypothetical protein
VRIRFEDGELLTDDYPQKVVHVLLLSYMYYFPGLDIKKYYSINKIMLWFHLERGGVLASNTTSSTSICPVLAKLYLDVEKEE